MIPPASYPARPARQVISSGQTPRYIGGRPGSGAKLGVMPNGRNGLWRKWSRTEPAVPGPMWYLTDARTGAMRRAPHQALISYHTPPPRPATSSATPRAGGAHYFLGRPGPPLRHGREPVALRFRDLSTARQARHNRVLPEHTSRLPHDAHLRRFFMGFPSTILVPPVRLSTTESHYLGFSALPFGDSRIV